MLLGTLIINSSGMQLYKSGFEKAEFLPSLISVALAISKELGGRPKSMEYENMVIYIVPSRKVPDILMVFGADRKDFATELLIRRLSLAVDGAISPGLDMLELKERISAVLDKYTRIAGNLPKACDVKRLAQEAYSSLPSDIKDRMDEVLSEVEKKEIEDEKERILTPQNLRVSDIDECARKFYSWDLYGSFFCLLNLAESEKSGLAKLLAAKIGSLILQLPPPHPVPSRELIEELLASESGLPEPIEEFVKRQVLAIVRDEREALRQFIVERYRDVIQETRKVPDDLRHAYSLILFIQSRTISRTPLADEIIEFLADKSQLLYRLMMNEKVVTRLCDMMYRPERWEKLRDIVNEYRLNFLRLKSQIVFPDFVPPDWSEAELLAQILELVTAFREYLLSILVASESFGLPGEEREKLLKEACFSAIPAGMKIVNLNPPLLFRVFHDIYSFSIYVLYYMTMLKTAREAERVWQEIYGIAYDGLSMFARMLMRGRIGRFHFLVMSSPMAFALGKFSMRYGGMLPEEVYFIKQLSEADDKTLKQLEMLSDVEKMQFFSHALIVIASAAKSLQKEKAREVLSMVADMLYSMLEWGLAHARISRELIDDFADIIDVLIDVSDEPESVKDFISKLNDIAEIFALELEESSFGAVVINDRLARLASKFLKKFRDEVVKPIAERARKVAVFAWKGINKPEKSRGAAHRMSDRN